MYTYFGTKTISLSNLQTILICVLSFIGFLRFSEVIKSRPCDIIINKTFLSVFIEKSKTDACQEGSWVYLAKLDLAVCHIELIGQYFKKQ